MPSTLRIEAVLELPDDVFATAAVLTAVRTPIDEAAQKISDELEHEFKFDITVVPAKKPRAPRGSKKAAANGASQSTQQNPNFAA